MIRMIKWFSPRSIALSFARAAPFSVSTNISSFKFSFLSAALVSLLASASFSAGDPYAGGYLGTRLGYSYNRHSCLDAAIECDRSDSGYGPFADYDVDNQLGIELSAARLGDTSVIYPDVKLHDEIFLVFLLYGIFLKRKNIPASRHQLLLMRRLLHYLQ